MDAPGPVCLLLALASTSATPFAQKSAAPTEPEPPGQLGLGGFTLLVEEYEQATWDAAQMEFTGATGLAWTMFPCLDVDVDPPTSGKYVGIPVRFTDLTIEPETGEDLGAVQSGTASYPYTGGPAVDIRLEAAGFTLHFETLELAPKSARSAVTLELPESLVDPATCQPARVALGELTVGSSCGFHGDFPALAWGPWVVGDTGVLVQGTGLVLDLDTGWSDSPTLPDSWRGLILPAGATVPEPTGSVISNRGYLKAGYDFSDGLVTQGGLQAHLALSTTYRFDSLLPHGFRITLGSGSIDLDESRVAGGKFLSGSVALPLTAAQTSGGDRLYGFFTDLAVQPDGDLDAAIDVGNYPHWGELVLTAPALRPFATSSPSAGHFYLPADHAAPALPEGPGGLEAPSLPDPIAASMESEGVHGAYFQGFDEVFVYSPESPGTTLRFTADAEAWIHVAGHGLHGELILVDSTSPEDPLGDAGSVHYQSNQPFRVFFEAADGERGIGRVQFLDSAVYSSDLAGHVRLDGAVDADVPFEGLAFTSTAQVPAAAVDLTAPVALDYWGVEVAQDAGAPSAGALSVRTGQVLLTAAGIAEPRHFAAPFPLIWGEVLAHGDLGSLFLDFDSSADGGQRFDGFPFTPEALGLSPYDPADVGKLNAFLQVGGTAHLDFFGSNYLNVVDRNDITVPAPPFDGRRIELATDTAFGTQPTDFDLERNWGNGFGQLEFQIAYDDVDQDGFRGPGTLGLAFLAAGDLDSGLDLNSERVCLTVDDYDRHDFSLGPVANFGSMDRTRGCACIVDGELERLLLTSELAVAGNGNVAVRAGAYGRVEHYLTPSLSETRLHGNFYASVLVGGDVEVDGHARFSVDRAADFVEGDLMGRIDSHSLLSGIRADGRLNWHLASPLGSDPYQSLQGRVAVEVLAPLSGSGTEAGFYLGINAPKSEAWVLLDKDSRFDLNTAALPARLTGIYGYARKTDSVNLYWVLSGGYEIFAGLGGFVDVGSVPVLPSGAGPEFPVVLPYVVGNLGARVWGEILGGALSASAWGNLQVIAPYPFHFEGTLALEGCALWALCKTVDVTLGLNTAEGFYID